MFKLTPLRRSILAALGVLSGCDSTAGTCEDSQPILVEGKTSGFVQCANGGIDRVEQVACDDPLPVGSACIGDEPEPSCMTDDDCTQQPHGRCVHFDEFIGGAGCSCEYGCATDGDCADGQVCMCGGIEGGSASPRCIASNCSVSDDCDSKACGFAVFDDGCASYATLTCRSDQDECRSDADCDDGTLLNHCYPGSLDSTAFYACKSEECAIGRPMVIDGRARVALPAPRDDWSMPVASPASSDEALNDALAARWASIAALEHASVGSFARFTLQLLALGAPADLLAETQRAAADEIEHARLAYGLASRFAGRAIGPGPIDGVGAPVPTSEREIVRSLILEACIGETLGVAEAMATAELCTDAEIKRVLQRVSADEQRHAELAWRTLAWLVKKNPSLTTELVGGLDGALQLFAPGADVLVNRAFGLLSSQDIACIRRRAFDEVIKPCMAALIANVPRPHATSPATVGART